MGRRRSDKGTSPAMSSNQGETFDYKKLAEAIVLAQKEAEAHENKEKDKQAEKQWQEWQNVLGQKKYSKENRFTRILHQCRNNAVGFFKIMVLPQKEARSDVATLGLIRISLIGVFWCIKWLCYLLTAALVFSSFYSIEDKAWTFSIEILPYAFISLMFARIIRIAIFEIEKMKGRNYLLSILSAVTALIAMILALVALFVR